MRLSRSLRSQTRDPQIADHKPGTPTHRQKDVMAATPAVPLSILGLSLLCLSILRGSADNSTEMTHEVLRAHNDTVEPTTNATAGGTTDSSATLEPHSSKGTTDTTEHVTTVHTSTPLTSGGTETTRSSTRLRTATTRQAETSTPVPAGSSASVQIIVIVVILLVLLIVLLVVLNWWRDHKRHRVGRVRGCLAARVRAVQSRLGGRLWPGKSGGLGEGEEEEEEEEEEVEKEGGEGDVEQGKGRNAESQEEKREEEEDDSSDDYSSLEGFDLRDRARQREREEEEEGKRASQNQVKEEEEEEGGKSGGATPAEKSEGGGMEECDLTAL
ncbi:hypothetical protein AAFF_G00179910 [Aldrovandia affinis]|uniref:Uncharacterized protein n=1 Tax=Aldrovandia affinis TaxID=143900 RepID=A0AAD7SYA1_9TELE|nr:hypothetical protein AAFF_G00179910 [Aldrovandia affinis]